jgi:23S rRNA (uracil1939-C5)-methyltransferase
MKHRLCEPETGTVAALNSDGEGVVREGKTAFVAGALPGELISFQRYAQHKGYDEARLLEILEASPERVTPGCAHFGVCGGCALQHLDHEAQLRNKDQELRDALERLGHVTPEAWLAPLRGPIWGYRRRARLGARYVTAKGRSLVGFRERTSSFVADINRCEVLAPKVGQLLPALSQMVSELSIRMRMPQIEVAVADNQTALVLRTLLPLTEADRQMLAVFEQQHGVRIYLQAGSPHKLETLDGLDEPLWYELPDFDIRLQFRPSDFIQVNGEMNRLLIARVVELLELDAESRVLDLFCGLGNFTLPLARRAASVVGIEGEESLVQRARDNATANQLDNVRFHAANLAGEEAAAECQRLAGPAGSYTHILIDPPRTGARDVLPTVAKLAPRRLVYVSCHPGSLARDLDILVREHGFVLKAAGIVDMFPHTNHVESVAVLDGPGAQS